MKDFLELWKKYLPDSLFSFKNFAAFEISEKVKKNKKAWKKVKKGRNKTLRQVLTISWWTNTGLTLQYVCQQADWLGGVSILWDVLCLQAEILNVLYNTVSANSFRNHHFSST